MKLNSVRNCTFLIRAQVEYCTVTGKVSLRCMLEIPAVGQRRGFTDAETLLASLRSELSKLQEQVEASDLGTGKT